MTKLFVAFRFFSLDLVRLGSQVSQLCLFTSPSLLRYSLKKQTVFSLTRTYASEQDRFNPEKEKRVATLDAFTETVDKSKETYLDLLHFYKHKDKHRRGHVEFIYVALKHMKEFGVHKDLEAYKSLIDVMPKGKFVAQNVIQAEFQHYPRQQQCIIDLLEEMEINGVCPDEDMEDLLANIFGRRSYAIRRYWRMMYWMPKMRNLSPWPVPEPLPDDSLELAKVAIQRITSVDPATKISVLETKEVKDAIDETWIVSGQSPLQQELIERHEVTEPLFVEGSFRVWLRGTSVNYFILRADPDLTPKPEQDHDDISRLSLPLFEPPTEQQIARVTVVHEQEDSVILATCATGSSSRDSLLSWIRLLQRDNPRLGEIPVLFTLKSPIGTTEPLKEIEGDDPVPVVVNKTPTDKQ
uniref:Evolutionarily conserved signaling intermediate in Toll pathway, mitochondrial n=1 Tax=Cuerna arida TaxID=1464854 RepID=A0A1B6FQ69_9HEMI